MFGQVFAHLVGDYVLQSDYMAMRKTASWKAALAHVLVYTIPFAFVTQSPWALGVICLTHLVIDKFRLARYVCWAKNFLAPRWMNIQSSAATPPPPRYAHFFEGVTPGPDNVRRVKIRNHPWSICKKTGYEPMKPEFMAVWLMIITDQVMHIGCNYLAIRYL